MFGVKGRSPDRSSTTTNRYKETDVTLLLLLSLLIRFVTPVDCVLCATGRLEISVRVQLDLSERHFGQSRGRH